MVPPGLWGLPLPQAHNLTLSARLTAEASKSSPAWGRTQQGIGGPTGEDGDIVKPEASRAGFSQPGTGRGQGQPHGAEDVVHEPETSCEDPPALVSAITPLGARGFYKPAQPHSSVMI